MTALLGAQRHRRIDSRGAKRRDERGQERRGKQDQRRRHQHHRFEAVHAVQDALEELPGEKRQHQSDPDADRRHAAALSQHLPEQGAWLRTDGDPDAELARPSRDDV